MEEAQVPILRKEYQMPDGRKAVFEYDCNGIGSITLEAMDMLMDAVSAAGTKHAEWIVWKDDQVMCSNCGQKRDKSSMDDLPWEFCSSCGAKMRRVRR